MAVQQPTILPVCEQVPDNPGVYVIQNTIDGKVYVGSAAVSLATRRAGHWTDLRGGRHRNRYLQRAWNKHGEAAFVFAVVELCQPVECLDREQWWMDKLGVGDRGRSYNLAPKAGNTLGTKRSAESRARIAEANRQRYATPEARAQQAERTRRHFACPHARQKLSETVRQRFKQWGERERLGAATRAGMKDPAVRERMRQVHLGKTPSQETRAKLREATLKRVLTPEQKAKISAAISAAKRGKPGKSPSAEARAKQSASLRKHWADPQNKAKMRAALRKLWADPVKRAQRLQAIQRALAARRQGNSP